MSNFMKELFCEEYDAITFENEENNIAMSETKVGELAHKRSMDRFYAMCDEAKDRAKYGN